MFDDFLARAHDRVRLQRILEAMAHPQADLDNGWYADDVTACIFEDEDISFEYAEAQLNALVEQGMLERLDDLYYATQQAQTWVGKLKLNEMTTWDGGDDPIDTFTFEPAGHLSAEQREAIERRAKLLEAVAAGRSGPEARAFTEKAAELRARL